MAESYEVAIRVISQKGTCATRHKIGDEWVIKDYKAPEGICLFAFNALLPFAWVLAFGGSFPWESDPDTATVVCPDPDNPVVFELRRLRK